MNRLRKWTALISIATLSISLIGCQSDEDLKTVDKEQIIRIADITGTGEEYIRSQYTDIYEFAHPKTKMEFPQVIDQPYYYGYDGATPSPTPDPVKALKKAMTGPNPPDLVKVNVTQLQALIEENLLAPMDPLAQRDQFDLNALVPAVREGLKTLGDGKLYGLAPFFNSNALVFNKKLFTDAGVPFPKDGMTWDEVFDLAKRVSKGDGKNRTYGLAMGRSGDIFYDMNMYVAPLGLNIVNDDATEMTVDSDDWEAVWKKMINLQKEKVITSPPDYSMGYDQVAFFGDPFMSGQAAMLAVLTYDIQQIIDANKNASKIKNFKAIDWDIVTLPTHPEAPNMGPPIFMDAIFAINAKAQNTDGAWELLKFMNGEDFSKLKSRSTYQFVSRDAYIKPAPGLNYNVKAFTKLTPSFESNTERHQLNSPNFYSVQDLGRQKLQLVLEGKKSVREALKEWQTEGNTLLKQNPTANSMINQRVEY